MDERRVASSASRGRPRRRRSARSSGGRSSAPVPSGSVKRDRRGHPVAAAERPRRPLGDDPAAGDDRDAVGELLGLVHVVRREEDGLAERAQPVDHVPGGAARRRVEARRRLVEEDQLRVADQRERDVEPPPLPARELRRERVGLLVEPDERDRLVDVARLEVVAGVELRGTRARSAPARRSTPAARRRRGCARRRRRAPGSTPSTLTSPAVRVRKPSRISTVVVLPAPFGPRKAKISPRSTSRSMPATASSSP